MVITSSALLTTATTETDGRPHSDLDVHTTAVDIQTYPSKSDNNGTIRVRGDIAGMRNYDTTRCAVGAQVQRVGESQWHGGLETVTTSARNRFRVGVTLTGLTSGQFHVRCCARPATSETLFVGNLIRLVLPPADIQQTPVAPTSATNTTNPTNISGSQTTPQQTGNTTTTPPTTTSPPATTLPKEVRVSSQTDSLVEYTFAVTGDLTKGEPDEDDPPANDTVTRTNGRVRVEGAVSYGDDRFRFSGRLIKIDIPDTVQVTVTD